jgi:hypothetical protein
MQLCLPLMKNIIPKVDVIGKCCNHTFINWTMWWANERKTPSMCIRLPMDLWNALEEMIDKGRIEHDDETQNEERHFTMKKIKTKMFKNVRCTFLS